MCQTNSKNGFSGLLKGCFSLVSLSVNVQYLVMPHLYLDVGGRKELWLSSSAGDDRLIIFVILAPVTYTFIL